MRSFFLFFLCHFGLLALQAQEWAPDGSLWYYSQSKYRPSEKDVYHKVESMGDTVIDNRRCQKLSWKRISRSDSSGSQVYTHESNDSVFFYQTTWDSFLLVYRFDANPGDTISGGYSGTQYKYWIDSIQKYTLRNGDTTNIQYVTNATGLGNEYLLFVSSPIIEGIGSLGWLFPSYSIADPPTGGGLMCYIEDGQRLYSSRPDCGIITSTSEVSRPFILGPNPATDKIMIESDEVIDAIEVRGLNGVVRQPEVERTIDLPDPPGVYVLRLLIKGKYYQMRVLKLGQ